MIVTDSKTLTDTALARLRGLLRGNGAPNGYLSLIDSTEKTYTLSGKLTLTPHLSIRSRTVLGRIKGKGRQILTTFGELDSQIQTLETAFKDNASWLTTALEELDKEEGHGWGHTDSTLTWSDKSTILAATENCPTCRGAGQSPCPECKGLGFLNCITCETRGREICILCSGTGRDPHDPQKECPTCHGTRYSLCRFCQGTGKLVCPTCQNKGNIPCPDCKGTGCISRETMVKEAAEMRFTLGATTDLPSGLLRMISRIGDEGLPKGHADIKLIPPSDEEKQQKGSIDIKLEAPIAYADIKVRFGKRAALVSTFGKKGIMTGVPPFLDEVLKPAREGLARAANGQKSIEDAAKVRALHDALKLVLSGKNNPNHLRRLYPVGLSSQAAAEIMKNMALALKQSTGRTRQVTALASVFASSGLFAAIFLTPTFDTLTGAMSPYARLGVQTGFLLLVVVLAWLAMLQITKGSLRRRFKDAQIALGQSIGKTGYTALAVIILVYLAILYASGHLV